MEGTFRLGDVLFVEILAPETVRAGDVIVFCPSERDGPSGVTVHRVMAQTLQGLVTQGDARVCPDIYRVQAAHLVGRVVRVQRGRRFYPVFGGWSGRLWVGLLRLWRRLLRVGRLPYVLLRASGLVGHLWRPPVVKVELLTGQGSVVKYLCAGKTVAVWRSGDRFAWCQKPYDLVLKPPLLS